MASRQAEAHIEAQARLRGLTVRTVRQIWRSLPAYNRENLDEWLSRVLPVIAASQRSSAALTDAYLAHFLDRRPFGIEAAIGAGVRNGTDPAQVYERPFVTLWTALGEGKIYADAVNKGLERALGTAAMDVQMSSRAAYGQVQEADDTIFGYQRVADPGACTFCAEVDGAYVKDGGAMPLHNNCGCGLEPLTAPHPRAAKLPSGVAVHEHGELGPVLGAPGDHFTTAADIPAI